MLLPFVAAAPIPPATTLAASPLLPPCPDPCTLLPLLPHTFTACTFSTEDEAVALANGNEFGLGSGIISADPERCK